MADDEPCARVRSSTAAVCAAAQLVRIDGAAAVRLAGVLAADYAAAQRAGASAAAGAGADAAAAGAWASSGWHYTRDDSDAAGERLSQYVLVLSSLNFCFWPSGGALEYEELARSLACALRADAAAFDAGALQRVDAAVLQRWLAPLTLPDADVRAAAVREVGEALEASFGGRAHALVAAAGGSAQALVALVLQHLPAFRDECMYAGVGRVCLYKRAQIFAADLWAAHGARTCASRAAWDASAPATFFDVPALTCFADYRLPQLLRAEGVLVYAPALAAAIDARAELPAGGEAEVEIRAATVQVVEALRADVAAHLQPPPLQPLLAVQIDWLLWARGEAARDTLPPHHRTRTRFY